MNSEPEAGRHRSTATNGERQLSFLEALDRVHRALAASDEIEVAVGGLLELLLDLFDCDRAWLGHVRAPAAAEWIAPFERTRAEFPGATARGLGVELDEEIAGVVRALELADGPVAFGSGHEWPVPALLAREFGVRSFIGLALRPKHGAPWAFGLHQCSRERIWSADEQRLLHEVGRRLADALSGFVLLRGLRDSEAKLEAALQLALLGYWDRNFASGCNELSAVTRRIFEVAPDLDVTTREGWRDGWRSRAHRDDWQRVESAARAALAGRERFDVEYRIVRNDGEIGWIHSRATVERDGEGRPTRMFGTVQDVTERRRTQESLAIFRSLIDHTSDSVEVIDLESGRFLDVNERACRDHGYSRDEYLALRVADIDPTAATPGSWERLRDLLRRKRSRVFRSSHRRKDGSSFPVEVSLNHVRLDREYALAVVRDVTELQQLEQQLRQAQKMEAIGRLAGGIAHDFNNLLTVINGYSGLVFGRLAPDDPGRELLAEVQHAGESAASLTRQLLAFGRQQVLEPRAIDVNQSLEDLGRLLGRLLGDDVELELRRDPSLGRALVDPAQLEQAIINLAVNARDAMPQGGRLTIGTREVALDDAYAERVPEASAGRFVEISVADTGTGMDAETLAHAFEPFFTTKEPGKGTGLGLAMVYGFVRQSGGHIEVESRPGAGAVFRIFLPLGEGAASATTVAPARPRGGSETILLVEDADAVRTFARIALQSYGYTVLEARDGQEAIWIAEQQQDELHLLISDVVMPRLSGPRLADLLRASRPTLRVLLVSGYPGDQVTTTPGSPSGFLQKPFRPAELARKVREILDAE